MNISIRQLQQSDLDTADQIFRLAFNTFLGVSASRSIPSERNYIHTRWQAAPDAAIAAFINEQLVGSNFATNWGSIGFFGPLSVHPDYWNQGVAQKLIAPVIEILEQWGIVHSGLFTCPHSPKHIHLYQKFGFWPRFLTAIMSKQAEEQELLNIHVSLYSEEPPSQRSSSLNACLDLTNAIYPGLNLEREIVAVDAQKLGNTLLLYDDQGFAGLAVCHYGPGTEAGSDTCYIKFGAVRPSHNSGRLFEQLLNACENITIFEGMSCLVAGVNTSREDAYRRMMARGFNTDILGVVMQKPNEQGYNRPDVYVLDDWR